MTKARPGLLTPAFLLITAATFVYFIGIGSMLPVLPRFVRGPLRGTDVDVGLAFGAFGLPAFFFNPVGGRLSDRRGRRVPMLLGATLVALAIAAYSAARSLPVLIALRLVSGVGEALFFVGAATAVNDLAPASRRGEAVSLFSVALFAGLAVGPVLSEVILDADRFTAVWITAAACIALAGLTVLRMPETRPPGLQAPAGRRLFHRPALAPGLVLAAGIVGQTGFSAFVPLYALQLGLDGSRFVFATFSGILLGIRSAGARIPDVLGARQASRAALICSAVGLALMGLWSTVPGLFIGTAIFALGQALLFPALLTMAVAGAPAADLGGMIGSMTAFIDLSFALGPMSLGFVAAAFGYNTTFLGSAVAALAALMFLVFSSPNSKQGSWSR
jgi:MFS family permease